MKHNKQDNREYIENTLSSTVEPDQTSNVEVEYADGTVKSYDSLASLRKDGQAYVEMLSAARQGLLFEVRIKADVFTDKPNKKNARPLPGDLDGFISRTEPNRPIMTDHQLSSGSHLGYILSMEKVTDGKNTDRLRTQLGFRDPSAQERTLRGLVRTFSIGWSGSSSECSICGKKYMSSLFGSWRECEHQLGQRYDGKLAEVYTRDAQLREVSITPFPASSGTRPRGRVLSDGDVKQEDEQELAETPSTVSEDMDKDQKIAELEGQLAEYKKQLADSQSQLSEATAFGKRLMFTRLQDERRLTPAECESDEVKSILSLGLSNAEKILGKYAQRPELSSETVSAPADNAADPIKPKGTPDVNNNNSVKAPGSTLSYLRSVGALPADKKESK